MTQKPATELQDAIESYRDAYDWLVDNGDDHRSLPDARSAFGTIFEAVETLITAAQESYFTIPTTGEVVSYRKENARLSDEWSKTYHENTQLRARIADLEQRQAWRGIESAPRDGTPYLAWAEGREVVYTWWGEVEGSCNLKKMGYRTLNGFWANFGACINPTHWQPLPDSPKNTGGE